MTKIKLCGLSRPENIAAANALKPDFVGFVFAVSRRQVTPEAALRLRRLLDPAIPAVGVFVDEAPDRVADLLNRGVIQIASCTAARARRISPGFAPWPRAAPCGRPSGCASRRTPPRPTPLRRTASCWTPAAAAAKPLIGPCFPQFAARTFWQAALAPKPLPMPCAPCTLMGWT